MFLPSPPPSFLYGLIAGFIGVFILRRLSPIITSKFGTPTFQQSVTSLDHGKLYHYHSLLPSTIHALAQIIGTFTYVFYGTDGYNDNNSSSSPQLIFDERTIVPYGITPLGPTVYMGIFVGYLLADVLSAPTFAIMGYPFVIHHFAASACWTFCACHRIMQPVGCLFQFNELSTPLMNIRQYYLTAGYKSSDLPVMVSTLSFFVAFGMVRVVPLPFVVKDWIYRDFGAIRGETGVGGAILLSVFFAVNALLQCSWFFIMCQKLAGILSSQSKKKVQ
ncbi:hypothetical protein ACHAXR_005257 [Thalassiosira sp. AJA248-18]